MMEARHLLSALWRNRTGPILIAVQIAITLAVLVNITYLIALRMVTYTQPTGMDIDNIFWAQSVSFTSDYDQKNAVESDLQWLNSLPGVIAAAAATNPPQSYWGWGMPFSTSPDPNAVKEGARVYGMTARGLDVLGVKLTAGRAYSPESVAAPASDMGAAIQQWVPEVVITQALADRLFPQGDALGKTLYIGLVNKSAKIVGIIGTMQAIAIYGPFARFSNQVVLAPITPAAPSAVYLVRTKPGRQSEVMARVERELADRIPGRYIARIEPLTRTSFETRNWMRTSSIILSVVTILVLSVSAIGICGLAMFNVTTRTKQIGTRRAVGARRWHILRYFLVENWLVTTGGVVVGCMLALAAGVVISHTTQAPRLPLYYLVGGVMFVWVLGLLSVMIPARRAAEISPAVATRTV
jgi:putative ABC transport system permease protein